MTTGNDQVSDWTKKKLQSTSQSPNLHQERSWSLFGGLLPIWSTKAFWIPAKPLHLRIMLSKSNEMYWKLQFLHLALVVRKGPILLHDNALPHITLPVLQKLNALVYEVLPHPPSSLDLSPTDYHHVFKHFNFLQGKCFYNQQKAEMLFKSLSDPKAWIFMLQEWTNIVSIGKNVLTVMVPILINKDVFEPSHNDLKFMVWKHNYFSTNQVLLWLSHVTTNLCVYLDVI